MSWVIAAYTIIWIAIFAFVFNMDRKQKSLAAEMERLKSRMGS